MRKLNILKTLIDLFFFFSIFTIAAMLLITMMTLFSSDGEPFPMKINGSSIEVLDTSSKIIVGFAMASGICFIYAIALLRKVIGHFVKREIFDDAVIGYFHKIGVSLIASAGLTHVPLFIYNAVHRNNIEFEFSAGGFDSFILAISLGLFFMVLSEVFKIAKGIKDENELTV